MNAAPGLEQKEMHLKLQSSHTTTAIIEWRGQRLNKPYISPFFTKKKICLVEKESNLTGYLTFLGVIQGSEK